jgi:ribosomal-protein-alanine N-acetyltransferase
VTSQDEQEFIRRAEQSRELHRPWIRAPTAAAEFERYVVRLGEDSAESAAGFLVCHRQTKDIVGFINLNEIVLGSYRRGLLGYGVFLPFAGQGYMIEGLKAVIDYAFGELELHRLEADIQPGNNRSLNLVKKLGFVREGLSVGFICIDGQWMDHERWALTAGVKTARDRPV